MCFLLSSHFNHSTHPHPLYFFCHLPPVSFIFSLSNNPPYIHLANAPMIQTPPPPFGEDFSTASALPFSLACPHVFIEITDGVESLCQWVSLL